MNCVVGSESDVHCQIVYSIVNQVFAAEFICPQRIRCSLSNCVIRNESSVPCWICVLCGESGIRCRIMLSKPNEVFTAEFVRFAANQVFTAKFVMSVVNQVLAAKFSCPWWIRCSLSNCDVHSKSSVCCWIYTVCNELSVRCWIYVVRNESSFGCWICVVHSELGFCCRIVLSASNQVLLSKLCCQQWICVRYRSCVIYSELTFIAKSEATMK